MPDFSAVFFYFSICRIKLEVEVELLSSVFFCNKFQVCCTTWGEQKSIKMYLYWKKSDFCKVEKENHHGLHTISKDGYDVTGVNSPKSAYRTTDICHSDILCQSKW